MTLREMEDLARAAPNPFGDWVLRNGFEPPPWDVPEIHAEERRKLRELIESVRSTGKLAIQVVTGEPGDGKTHLLATLREEAEQAWLKPGTELAMVPIDPLREPEAPFQHVLRSGVSGLRRPLGFVPRDSAGPATPLDYILWRILRRMTKALAAAGVAEAIDAEKILRGEPLARFPGMVVTLLRDRWPALGSALARHSASLPEFAAADSEVLTVISRYPRHEASHLAVRWLGGESLPEDELAVLGVTRPIDGEDRAFRALSTLLHLSDAPIVLAFDQLEGVARLGSEAVETFLQALGDQLFTAGGRAVVLLFCQADVWSSFLKRLQGQTRDRFSQRPPMHLGSMTPDLGEKLIARRLDALWKGQAVEPPHPTFPFPPGFVRKAIEENNLRAPRRVLSFFEDVGLTSSPAKHVGRARKEPREVAREEYARIRGEVAREPTRSPEEQASLTQAGLGTVLGKAAGTALAGAQVVRAKPHAVSRSRKSGLEARLARGGKEVTIYAEATNARHGASAAATTRRMKDALKAGADRAVLLRDERLPLPAAAGKMLAELGPSAAKVDVTAEEAGTFAAVERLLNRAASRDIEVAPDAAASFVLEEIAPTLEVVRRFLDAAFAELPRDGQSGKGAASESAREKLEETLEAAVSRPPFVVSEAQLAKAHGLPADAVAQAADALESRGKATVLKSKDGDRTVLRRPR